MPVNYETVNALASAIVREIPANRIGEFVTRFANAAAADSCGDGCGSGCCGAACAESPENLGVIDVYGHTRFNGNDLNDIGSNQLNELRESIRTELTNISGNI